MRCPKIKILLVVPLALATVTQPEMGIGGMNAQAPLMTAPVQELTLVCIEV